MSQDQLGPNQPTRCEEEQEAIPEMATQIGGESTSQLIASTSTNNGTQSLDVPRPIPETSGENRVSIEGKFGWAQFGDKFIPYLMRSQKKYVSVQMMDHNVFCNYKQYFKEEVYHCFKMEELELTNVEAKILNQINFDYCKNSLGPFVYPGTGRLISLNDAKETYDFFNFCFKKLVQKSINTSKGGFVRSDAQNCIPYVWIDYRQYVPLFFFGGEWQHLEKTSVELKGWMLAYMKLFCKIQGIRKSLFDHSSVRIVHLQVVKKFFDPKTSFEECWPTHNKIESLIVNIKQVLIPCENNQEDVQQTCTKATATSEKDSVRKPHPVQTARSILLLHHVPDGPNRNTEDNSRALEITKPASITDTIKRSYNRCRIWSIPSYILDRSYLLNKDGHPYTLRKAQVETTILNNCINLIPYTSTALLVGVGEIAESFRIPLKSLVKAINYLRLEICLPNVDQKKLLEANGVYPLMGLIKLNSLIHSINGIKSVISSSILTEQ